MGGVGWFVLLAACAAVGQSPSGSRAQVMTSSGALLSLDSLLGGRMQGEIMREIDDPHTGDRWLLVRSDEFPGGPGRMVLVSSVRGAAGSAQPIVEAPAPPVIRSGDRLVVEEHTAVVDAVLEARALGPAAVGAAFHARLAIGGRVVRVLALGEGRAALQPETEMRP